MKFKNILHYLGLLLIYISSLIGSLLILGEKYSLLFIVGGLILVFSLSFLVKYLTKKREETNQNISEIIILAFLYVANSIFYGILSIHFITFQLSAFEEIKIGGNKKLDTIIEIRKEFINSVNDLDKNLSMEISNLLQSYKNAPAKSLQRRIKKNVLIDTFKFPESTLLNLKSRNINQNTSNWIESNIINRLEINQLREKNKKLFEKSQQIMSVYNENKNVFNDPQYFKISNLYFDLNQNILDYKNFLQEEFEIVCNEFDISSSTLEQIDLPENEIKINSFKALNTSHGSFIHILIYIIINLMILSPFIFATKKGLRPLVEDDLTTEL